MVASASDTDVANSGVWNGGNWATLPFLLKSVEVDAGLGEKGTSWAWKDEQNWTFPNNNPAATRNKVARLWLDGIIA